jgi:DNA-binding NarL/FixJ family response regulator
MSTQRVVRVLVVDDQRPFRFAAAAVLARMPGFELVGKADTGEDAVVAAASLRPDLVLMDVRLPGMTGIEAAGLVATEVPGVVVILCSTYARDDLPFSLDAPGVAGYLHKEELRAPVLRELWERFGPSAPAASGPTGATH